MGDKRVGILAHGVRRLWTKNAIPSRFAEVAITPTLPAQTLYRLPGYSKRAPRCPKICGMAIAESTMKLEREPLPDIYSGVHSLEGLGPRTSMKKFLLVATFTAVGSFGLSSVSIGHGGTYRGPGDTVPPVGSGPTGGGPTGPTSPTGPPGPHTGGPAGTGPISGPSQTGGTAGGPRPAATTGIPFGLEPDLTNWAFWWEFNKDGYINLKAAVHGGSVKTGEPGFFIGDGRRYQAGESYRPTAKVIREQVVPALIAALQRETNNDIVTGCMIALAKIGEQLPEGGQSQFEPLFRRFLPDSNQEISETAALALGILANDSSAPVLLDLLRDNQAGRDAVGRLQVNARRRSFAAYGLGLIGFKTANETTSREIVAALSEVLESSQSSTRDLEVACVIGIGLVKIDTIGTPRAVDDAPVPAQASRLAQIDYLRDYFRDKNNQHLVRAHCPSALVKLVGSLPKELQGELKEQLSGDLLECIGKRTAKNFENVIQQSAVLALGQLGDCDNDAVDVDIREALASVGHVANQQVRHFAKIALGQVGGRPGDNGDSTEGRRKISAELSRGLASRNAGARWSAIGIGVMGRSLASSTEAWLPDELSIALRSELKQAKSPEDVGAFAVALGILGDEKSSSILLDKLDRLSAEVPRGYAALALGLINHRGAIGPIKKVVLESKYRPELLKQAAIALGLLGDKKTVIDLIEMLGSAKSLAAQASISSALGFIGDRRSIAPLIEMLENDSLTGSARGFAAVALGIVGDKESLPWNSKISTDINYRASTETLNSADAGTGILNIL